MLRLVLLVSALQSALLPFQQNRVVYNAPIDSAYTLRAEESHFPKWPGVCCTSLFRLLLVDRANPNRYWEIAAIPEEYEYTYTVKPSAQIPATEFMKDHSRFSSMSVRRVC